MPYTSGLLLSKFGGGFRAIFPLPSPPPPHHHHGYILAWYQVLMMLLMQKWVISFSFLFVFLLHSDMRSSNLCWPWRRECCRCAEEDVEEMVQHIPFSILMQLDSAKDDRTWCSCVFIVVGFVELMWLYSKERRVLVNVIPDCSGFPLCVKVCCCSAFQRASPVLQVLCTSQHCKHCTCR